MSGIVFDRDLQEKLAAAYLQETVTVAAEQKVRGDKYDAHAAQVYEEARKQTALLQRLVDHFEVRR